MEKYRSGLGIQFRPRASRENEKSQLLVTTNSKKSSFFYWVTNHLDPSAVTKRHSLMTADGGDSKATDRGAAVKGNICVCGARGLFVFVRGAVNAVGRLFGAIRHKSA